MDRIVGLPDFKDIRIEKAVSSFLDGIQNESNSKNRMYATWHMSHAWLKNIYVEDISKKSLTEYFESHSYKRGSDISTVFAIIISMIKAGLAVNEDLFQLVMLEDFLLSRADTANKLSVLYKDMAKYYYGSTFRGDKESCLY